jgi:hypothetical protein
VDGSRLFIVRLPDVSHRERERDFRDEPVAGAVPAARLNTRAAFFILD